MLMDDIKQFDEAFPDGVYAVPRSSKEPKVKVRHYWTTVNKKELSPKNSVKKKWKDFLNNE